MDSTSRKVVDLLADIASSPDKNIYTREEVILMLENILCATDEDVKK